MPCLAISDWIFRAAVSVIWITASQAEGCAVAGADTPFDSSCFFL